MSTNTEGGETFRQACAVRKEDSRDEIGGAVIAFIINNKSSFAFFKGKLVCCRSLYIFFYSLFSITWFTHWTVLLSLTLYD